MTHLTPPNAAWHDFALDRFSDLNKRERRWLIRNLQVKSIEKMAEISIEKFYAKSWDSPLAFKSEPAYNLAAGWSSPVAREAHNLEVAGSNPVSAT